jgi:hypothetical protein
LRGHCLVGLEIIKPQIWKYKKSHTWNIIAKNHYVVQVYNSSLFGYYSCLQFPFIGKMKRLRR